MKNAKGFAVETLLIGVIIVMVAGIGWYTWNARNKTNISLNNADAAAGSVVKYPKKIDSVSSTTAATEAIKSYCTKNGVTACKAARIVATQGDFVKVAVANNEISGGGFLAIVKKDANNNWTVIWAGQQIPSQADAQKYGLPSAWGPYL